MLVRHTGSRGRDGSFAALNSCRCARPTDDPLESLEPWGGPQLEGALEASQQLDDSGGGGGDPRGLAALLSSAASAGGALAALDAVQYVGGLALQQAQQLRQQHCAELAAFQWANEHLLPPEAAAAAAGVLEGAELSAANAAAAGAAVPPVHPAVAAWAVRRSRRQVLQRLEAASATLLSLDAPLQQWQRQLAAVQQRLEEEVAGTMPFASADLHQQLQQQQRWLQAAAGHTANLLEVGQAVAQLEASRTVDAPDTLAPAGAEGAAAAAAPLANRYAAEQREGWQRYTALLQQMQALHSAHAAAERTAAAAAAELEQLRLRRREADAIAQSAEAAGSNAAASFAASALPLVKATQQLPTAVNNLLPRLTGGVNWAQQLRQAHGWAAELAAVAAATGAEDEAAAAAAERLAVAAACMEQLPAAVQQLQAALLPARNRLLAGGRGEMAAQQQAADVIDALSLAITQLQPQVGALRCCKLK